MKSTGFLSRMGRVAGVMIFLGPWVSMASTSRADEECGDYRRKTFIPHGKARKAISNAAKLIGDTEDALAGKECLDDKDRDALLKALDEAWTFTNQAAEFLEQMKEAIEETEACLERCLENCETDDECEDCEKMARYIKLAWHYHAERMASLNSTWETMQNTFTKIDTLPACDEDLSRANDDDLD